MGKIKLYQWPSAAGLESASPFCNKVHYALRLKRLEFEVVNVGDPAEVQKLNVWRKLPVVEYDGVRIPDSTVILRYIEERHPTPALYPGDAQARALALILEDWADESLYWHLVYERWQIEEHFKGYAAELFAGAPASLTTMMRDRIVETLAGQGFGRLSIDDERLLFGRALDSLDGFLSGGKFLCGGEPSVADVSVFAEIDGLDRPLTPQASALIRQRANVANWLARMRPLVGRG